MPAVEYANCGLNARSYIGGYQLLQSFTTGATAQALQTAPITLATLNGLSGVLPLDGAGGASFIFARTSGATTLTAWVTAFEPILNPAGVPIAYIEQCLSSTAAVALTTGVQATTVTLDPTTLGVCATTAPAVTTIPTTALWVSSSAALTGNLDGFVESDAGATSGIARWRFGVPISYAPAGAAFNGGGTDLGFTHLRVLLSCATASESIFCLAKRLRGGAILQ